MDKGKNITLITLLMVLLFAGHASASFKNCYKSCIADCFASAREATFCAVKCLAKCIKAESTDDTQYSCNFGCASDQCARFTDDVDKVDDCFKKCETDKCKNKLSQAVEYHHASATAGVLPTQY